MKVGKTITSPLLSQEVQWGIEETAMTKKEKLISFLAAAHLLIVCLGAGQIEVIKWPIIGNALAYYGALTGASSGYGFFAPGVGSSFRAEFDVASKSNSFTTKLEQNNNRESDLRFGNILGMLSL